MKRNFCETLNLLVAGQEKFKKSDGTVNVASAARALKIHQPTLKRMLDGQSAEPKAENAKKICNYFKISLDQLMGHKPINYPDIEEIGSVRENPAAAYSFANFKRTRINGTIGTKQVQISFEDDFTVYPRAYRKDWIDQYGLDPEYLHAREVSGSSMEPALYQGDTVLINRKSTDPKHGRAYEIIIEEDICIKRLKRREGVWWVTSDNPAYSNTDLPLEDSMTIIGEAVEKSSMHV